jgi:hypothetical protein
MRDNDLGSGAGFMSPLLCLADPQPALQGATIVTFPNTYLIDELAFRDL